MSEDKIKAKRIIKANVVDIVCTSSTLVFVCRKADGTLQFYCYNASSGTLEESDVGLYLISKFGPYYNTIVTRLKDYLSCDACTLENGETYVVYPSGEMGHFDPEGNLIRFGHMFYDDAPIRDCAAVGNNVFCCVPGRNCLVRLDTENTRIDMRIGGDEETRFNMPVSVFYDCGDSCLYINNKVSSEVLKMDATTFEYKGKIKMNVPANKFYKVLDKQIAVLDSGIYLIN